MAFHLRRSWEHETDETLVCIELYCDVTNELFYRETKKVGKKEFVKP